MLKKAFLAIFAAVVATGAAAATKPIAADVYPGVFLRGPFAERSDPANAFDGTDAFYSLGIGGLAVFDFGVVNSAFINIFETTFVCTGDSVLCENHPESAIILVSDTYGFDGDISGFVSLGEIGNSTAQGGAALAGTSFRFVAVLDTTGPGTSFDGFDLESIYLTPIPLPPTAMALGAAMAGLLLLRRRKRVA